MRMYKPDQGLINRLLMKVDPLFFSYSKNEQTKRRQLFDGDRRDQICSFLYRELFDLEYIPDSDDSPLNDVQQHTFNAHTTALLGIGENSFRLCEFQADDFDLSKFDSLYHYDIEDFDYQKQSLEKFYPSYKDERAYRLYLNHLWVRLLDVDQHFYYSTLLSLSHYLFDTLQEAMQATVKNLIPYEYIEGPEHGENVEGGMSWDFQTNANGLEAELIELKSRGRSYINAAYSRLNDEFHSSTSNEVYFMKHGDEVDGPHWDVIVNNAETAKQISFTSFLSDCQRFVQPIERLEKLKEREMTTLHEFLLDAHQDILKNFDPKIIKLEKKMKVVMTPGALDDLSKLSGGDEI